MIAFLRDLSPDLGDSLKKEGSRRAVNVERARKQHANYRKALAELGVEVELLPPLPNKLDSVFVDEFTVLLPEVAIVGRPATGERNKEAEAVASVLAQYRPVQWTDSSAELSGSDVLCIGHTLYVSLSKRTNADGIASLQGIVRPFGYEVKVVEVRGEKSLREVCSFAPPRLLVVHQRWINPSIFDGLHYLQVPDDEPFGASTLTLGNTTLISASCPKTEKRLKAAGLVTRRVEISELEKLGGNLTRLVLIKESRVNGPVIVHSDLKTLTDSKAPFSVGHASPAIIYGGLVYVSLQFPFDPASVNPPSLTPEQQTERVLSNIAAVLNSAGCTLANVLRATVHLADPRHLGEIESAYARIFAEHRPVRSILSNQALPPGVLVAIEVVAVIAADRHP